MGTTWKSSLPRIPVAPSAPLRFTSPQQIVSKPVLGRGLGNLLKDPNATSPAEEKPGNEGSSAPPSPAPPTALSPGMATLLRGKNAEDNPDNPPGESPPPV